MTKKALDSKRVVADPPAFKEKKISKDTPVKAKAKDQVDTKSADSKAAKTVKKAKKGEQRASEAAEPDLIPKVAPKKPMSAYFFYSLSQRPKYAEKGVSVCESSKHIAAEWKLMTESDKAPYIKQSEDDHKRHEREI